MSRTCRPFFSSSGVPVGMRCHGVHIEQKDYFAMRCEAWERIRAEGLIPFRLIGAAPEIDRKAEYELVWRLVAAGWTDSLRARHGESLAQAARRLRASGEVAAFAPIGLSFMAAKAERARFSIRTATREELELALRRNPKRGRLYCA